MPGFYCVSSIPTCLIFMFCLVCAGGSDGGDDRSGNQGSERNLFRKTGSNAGSNAE